MLDREIKRSFEESDETILIDEKRKQETITYLMQEMDCVEEYTRINSIEVFLRQICYMDKTMFGIQLLIECIVMITFLRFGYLGIPREDMIAYAMILSGMLGVLVSGVIHRGFASHMAELSETCFFHTKQMVVFQMLCAGISSLIFLTVGILFVGMKWQVNLMQIGLYMLVPFVFSACCCLGATLTQAGRRSPYTFVVVGLLAGVLYMVLASIPYIYQTAALLFWRIALGVGVCSFGIQLNKLFRDIEKGEILCMN